MPRNDKVFISTELDWAEEQLKTWKDYIDNNPLHELKDRINNKVTKGGTIPVVIATIESQGKFIQETMKNYLALLEVAKKLRETDIIVKEARGAGTVPHRMK